MARVHFLLDEEWLIIKNYQNYSISNYGKVKRIKSGNGTRIGKILNLASTNNGYLSVTLYENNKRKNFYVHRLVIEAFIGPCPKDKETNHIDGDKINNYYKNLEYVTKSENQKHAFRLGLQRRDGENNHRSKITNRQVIEIRKLYKTGKYYHREIAKKFNIAETQIGRIIRKQSWKYI